MYLQKITRLFCLLFCLSVIVATGHAQQKSFAVVSAQRLASQAGEEIIQQGGNAFDAAVALSAALAVVEPYASGLGGGGFWLLHNAKTNQDIVVDGREVAPLAATATMYLDENGQLTRDSIDGPLAAGIPGVVAALEWITDRYGRLSLAQNLQPAIRLAKQGFLPGGHYLKFIKWRQQAILNSKAAAEIFLQAGQIPTDTFVIRQQDLGATLEKIAAQGAKVFYQGELANKLVAGVRQAGGIWQLKDLHQYKIIERQPIRVRYRHIDVVLPPPPTSGGVVIKQILAMLENTSLGNIDGAENIHIIVEAMRRAYQDRAVYLGDPDFTPMPMQTLLNDDYAKQKFSNFDRHKATKSQRLNELLRPEGKDTTHFSVIDSEGNYVAATLSINYPFGSGFVAPGTGILLNDEMDDFSMGADIANAWGLVGSQANAIEPGKRMLSSMTPLFAYDGRRTLIAGTPGGSRIISMLALALLKFQQGAGAHEIVSQRRFHHQYLPDEIQFEPGALSQPEQQGLLAKGHPLKELKSQYGNMHAIIRDTKTNTLDAAADPRGEGLAIIH